MDSSRKPAPSLTPSFSLASHDTGRVVTDVESPKPHLGWHSRVYLPHWDHPGMIQSINFRLADSLPSAVVEKWRDELALTPAGRAAGAPRALVEEQPESQRATGLRRRVEGYLDAGHGGCWLRQADLARLVEGALLHFDPERYRLLAWCIMPDHVHALIETREGFPLAEVLHSWKSYTGSKANQWLRRRGEFWQREYLDRFIRHAGHHQAVIAYIEENPVKAGLVRVKTDWPWSSARFRPGAPASLPASWMKIESALSQAKMPAGMPALPS